MHKTELEKRFFETLAENGMLNVGDKVLCAVSGGADSMCLLHLMLKFKSELGIRELCAAHVNHCIRGDEADCDEACVSAYCEQKGVKLYTLRKDVPAVARELSKGIEETARQIRYGYFDELCALHGFDKLAVAHNLTDNCETVIFNLVRGSGADGLRGIMASRDNIIRPLIDISKDEIRAYCKDEGIAYRFDSTNADVAYSRNRIRNNVLPELAILNACFERNVRNASVSLIEDADFIKTQAAEYVNENASGGRFTAESFTKLHPALKKRVLMLLYKNVLSSSSAVIEKIHLDRALSFIESRDSGKYIVLPHGVKLFCEFGVFHFEKKNGASDAESVALTDGDNIFADEAIKLLRFKRNAPNTPDIVYTLFKQAFFDCDKIIGEIYVRTRKAGDRIASDGITKSVKEFFINKKIPLTKRDVYPIVCDAEGIIWVPEMCVADRVKISDGTENVLTLKIENIKK